MNQNDENFQENSNLPFVITPISDPSPGQVQFCHNLNIVLLGKCTSQCQRQFLEVEQKDKHSTIAY